MTPRVEDYAATIEWLQARATHAFFEGDLGAAMTLSVEGQRRCREAGDLFILESMQRNLGMISMTEGDLDTGKRWLAEALRTVREIDHRISQ